MGVDSEDLGNGFKRIHLPDGLDWPAAEEAVKRVQEWEEDGGAAIDLVIDLYRLFKVAVPAADDSRMVLVPREPTKQMIDEAWAAALEENAAGVWRDMIAEWEAKK